MATSLDGYIATKDDDTPWSDETWEHYYEFVAAKGNFVVGRKTYDLMNEINEFEKLNNPFTVVLTNGELEESDMLRKAGSPKEAIDIVKERGFEEVIIGGGGKVCQSFFEEKLIDEIHLDINPILLGDGIPLYDKEEKLTLISLKQDKDTIRTVYKVVK